MMRRVWLVTLLFALLAGCGTTTVSTGPKVHAGPIEVGLHLNSNGEITLDGALSVPIVEYGIVGAEWDFAFSTVLNKVANKQNYLIVLWEDSGSIYESDFNIGQPFDITFGNDQWVRNIKRIDGGNIVVAVEKQKIPTEALISQETPKESPQTSPDKVRAVRPSKTDLNTLSSIWDVNNISNLDLASPGIRSYQVTVSPTDKLLWAYYWCTSNDEVLENNLNYLTLEFQIDGTTLPDNLLYPFYEPQGDWKCKNWDVVLDDWRSGEVIQLDIRYIFSADVYDGYNTYPAGEYIYQLIVSVR